MTAPDWLVALHAALGEALRAPLTAADGRLEPARPSPALAAAVRADPGPSPTDRVALYQRQVWQRLLHTAQGAHPRLTRALGPWTFNHVAHAALQADAPRGHDLGVSVAVVGPFLRAHLPDRPAPAAETEGPLASLLREVTHPARLLHEAARADEAEQRALRAPWTATRPAAPAITPTLRLRATAGFSLVRETHDVVTWPQRPPGSPAPALSTARTWVIARSADGHVLRCVDPVHARLLAALLTAPLGEALDRAAAALAEPEAAHLREHLAAWLTEALTEGWLTA